MKHKMKTKVKTKASKALAKEVEEDLIKEDDDEKFTELLSGTTTDDNADGQKTCP